MKSLLITGAGGFLGRHLCRMSVNRFKTVAISLTKQVFLAGVDSRLSDLSVPEGILTLLEELQPDIILHAAALADPNTCETDPESSYRVNVAPVKTISEFCAKNKKKLIFISTDLVFNGKTPPYSESRPVSPICIYGRHKAEAEEIALETCPDGLVIRVPLMYGVSGNHAKGIILPLADAVRNQKSVTLFKDEIRTPVNVETAASGIMDLAATASGIFHLGGPERISRYELGIKILTAMKLDTTRIVAAKREALPMPAPRAEDVSLSSEKASKYGFNPGAIDADLRSTLDRYSDILGGKTQPLQKQQER